MLWHGRCARCGFVFTQLSKYTPTLTTCDICRYAFLDWQREPFWTVKELRVLLDEVKADLTTALAFANHSASCRMVVWEPDCDCGLYALKQKYRE